MASLFPEGHGPLLPNFSSLLVKGPYPIACPVNLALSFPNRSVIILSACDKEDANNSLRASLQGLKLTGKISLQAGRVQIFYPPTAAHMALLLSTLQVIDTEHPISTSASTVPMYNPHQLKPPGPGLVIIHELSIYFNSIIEHSSSPSSSYLSLLARVVSLTSRLGASLAVFDKGVNVLKMPVHPSPNPHLEHLQAITPLLANFLELIIDFSEESVDGAVYRTTQNSIPTV
ncbi:hypothetical protein EV361DRAFT_965444, partial [Lentinula raphanica]